MKSVLIIVLNWNGWRDTVKCLTSLERLTYRNFRVFVVDNDSTDDSVSQIRHAFPNVAIIEAEKNLGFAAGCNLGIRQALQEDAEYVWLLNNDINFWLGRSRHFLNSVPNNEIEFLTGASLLLRRCALDSVGLLDEGFFMYWEDGDYCFRLREAGWTLAVAGDSLVWHKEQGTVGKKSTLLDTYFNRSATRFFARHAPIPFISIWVGVGLRIAKRIFIGDWKRARVVWASVRNSVDENDICKLENN